MEPPYQYQECGCLYVVCSSSTVRYGATCSYSTIRYAISGTEQVCDTVPCPVLSYHVILRGVRY
eukprot:1134340-Rhodomonas_salina.2